ncbi:hypothetical protein V6N11_079809 [Hibiscus sabdariffa]|uniref:Uncharacterized protein n=1 Tax=Hibiscus sabdariffa TaxID=183260 RepID=A0ABR2RWX7_9ROSI
MFNGDKTLWDETYEKKKHILLNCLKLAEVPKATTCAIEAVLVSFIHAPSQYNAPFVPIHHVPNQDNAPSVPVHHDPGQENDLYVPIDPVPNQDFARRNKKRQSRSALPAESLVNWVVSEKQGPNGRFDQQLCLSMAMPARVEIPLTTIDGRK